MSPETQQGFTLVEVLVALVIATLGVLAVTTSTLYAHRNAISLREESLAHWVAMNVATDFRVSGVFPDVGTQDGDVEFAGVQWRWAADISDTDVEGLRRVDLEVSYDETPDDVISSVSVFVSEPVQGVQFRSWTGTPARNAGPRQPQ